MKYLVIAIIVGLHLPLSLVAFTLDVSSKIQQPITIIASNPNILCSRQTLTTKSALSCQKSRESDTPGNASLQRIFTSSVVASFLSATMIPLIVFGVSGGGLDYANIDITGQDFSGKNYKGKDFTQVIAKATNFAGSNLQGCRFYKAYLVRTDFSGADLRGASLEDTSMDEASFRNTVAIGAYFSNSIIDAKDLENADFTDAQFPAKTLALLCQRNDVKGTNPTTGADTRESLMCP